MFQHYSIKVAARALANPPGGVETNRRSAIQVEIAWTAADIASLPAGMIAKLRACEHALAGGVEDVVIVDGRDRAALEAAVTSVDPVAGTRIVAKATTLG